MKIGQLIFSERLFQNYGIYWINNRQLIYVRVWWLRSDDCSALFKLLSLSLVCQLSMLLHPLPTHALELGMITPTPHPVLINDSSGSCIYCFAALQAVVSWADTFNGHSLTSVRSDHGGIVIYWRLWCRSPFFRPSVSLGVAYQLHISSHPPHPQWSYREVHLNFTSWQSSLLVYARVQWLQYEDCSTRMPTCSFLIFRYTSGKFQNDNSICHHN